MKIKQGLLFAAIAASLLVGCDSGSRSDYDFSPAPVVPAGPDISTQGPLFDPANALMPATNDLLFSGSKDGTLNIPNADNNALLSAVNKLDGFSTTTPLSLKFGTAIQTSSIKIGDNVRIFEVTKDAKGLVRSVSRELSQAEVTATTTAENSDTLVIVPLAPLKAKTSYMVVVTNGVKVRSDTMTKAAVPSATYQLTKASVDYPSDSALAALNTLRAMTYGMESVAKAHDASLLSDKIVVSWSFTTQSTSDVLDKLAANVSAGKIGSVKVLNPSPLGAASIASTTLTIPYYLKKPSATDPTAVLTSYWTGADGSALTRHNPMPEMSESLPIPVLMSIPVANALQPMPATGWPVVIFQHGITRNRVDMLAVADSLALAGFAAVAIDLPLHGVTDQDSATVLPFKTSSEFTFGVDYVTENSAGQVTARVPDGVEDRSGSHFLNLSNLLTIRDNIRQGVLNLLVLRKTLESSPSFEGVTLDGSRIGFVGHSLGGMVGAVYLGAETKPTVSSLVSAAGGIPRTLDASARFGETIRASLAAAGVTGAAYQNYLVAAQWILDSADPINYAKAAVAKHPIHMIEVIGDQVVPNAAGAAGPLSGTEPLAAVMGLASVSQPTSNPAMSVNGIVRFTKGNHGSLLNPIESAAVTQEMQSQVAAYQASFGQAIPVLDTSVVK